MVGAMRPSHPRAEPRSGSSRALERPRALAEKRPAARGLAFTLAASVGLAGLGCKDDDPSPATPLENAVDPEDQTPPRVCPLGWRPAEPPGTGASTTAPCEPEPGRSPLLPRECPEGWRQVAEALCAPDEPSPLPERACPPGWARRTEDGLEVCDPFPDGGPRECGPYEARYPGAPGCARIGAPCPEGIFPEGLPQGASVIYVSLAASPGGDGTRPETAYDSLDAVPFDRLPQHAIVALGRGTYTGSWTLAQPVTLWGACPEATVLRSEGASLEAPILDFKGGAHRPTFVLTNLRLGDSPRPGVRVRGSGALSVSGVVLEGVENFGILAYEGATLDIAGSIFRDIRLSSVDGRNGVGVITSTAAHATVERVLFTRLEGAGIFAARGGRVVGEDFVMLDGVGVFALGAIARSGGGLTLRRVVSETGGFFEVGVFDRGSEGHVEESVLCGSRSGGSGLVLDRGTSGSVLRSRFDGCGPLAINVADGDEEPLEAGDDSFLRIEEALIRNTRAVELGGSLGGQALAVGPGADVEIERSVVAGNQLVGLRVVGGGHLRAERVLVRDTRPLSADGFSVGISVQATSTAELRAVTVDGAHVGLGASGGFVVAEDLVARRVDWAVYVFDAGRVEARGLVLDRGVTHGIALSEPGSSATVSDAFLRGSPEAPLRIGVGVGNDATARIERVLVEHIAGTTFVAEGGSLEVHDALVREPADPGVEIGVFERARGAASFAAGQLVLRRAAFEESRVVEVVGVTGPGSRADIEDLVVRSVRSDRDDDYGWGLSVRAGAHARARGVVIEGAHGAGARVEATGSSLRLEDALVRGTRAPGCSACEALPANVLGLDGASLTIEGAWLDGSAGCGLLIDAAEVTLVDARVTANRIGACVSGRGVDYGALTGASVLYRDNDAPIRIDFLPTPEPPPEPETQGAPALEDR